MDRMILPNAPRVQCNASASCGTPHGDNHLCPKLTHDPPECVETRFIVRGSWAANQPHVPRSVATRRIAASEGCATQLA